MKSELEALESDIVFWRTTLDQEGVWLFIATLGCWSVPQGWLRVTALVITFIIFAWRAISQQKDMKPFSKRFDELQAKIKAEIADEIAQKATLYDLGVLRARLLGYGSLKRAIIYSLCMIFFAISVVCATP